MALKECRVHGFMHEVLASKAKQFEICQIFEDKESTSLVDPESRRLSLHGGAINTLEITVDQSRDQGRDLFFGELVNANDCGSTKELKKLRQLRCLSVSKSDAGMATTLFTIEKMNHLESLVYTHPIIFKLFDLESISAPPPFLGRLIFKGRLEKLPDWTLPLQNLSILGLSFSRLVVDTLKSPHALAQLSISFASSSMRW
ncbi:hypothetical protein L484_009529 [Morus notabilis]|uniref:Uncharacterized protein n=1 Tax=Morus notabilis TaxID=981085 RepID=W9RSM1_9ROSA|nr:hypothetical protein L484_009529 [Morus notabilis]